MTLQGINWIALLISAVLNTLYAQFIYLPQLEKKGGKTLNKQDRFIGPQVVFFYSIVLGVAVWNILLIPQITFNWALLGIWLPLVVLPRFVAWAYLGFKGKFFDLELERAFTEIAVITTIAAYVLGK